MSLRSKTFFISKGDSLDRITSSIEKEIGLDAYLIKELQASSTNELVTELTVLYLKYDNEMLTSLSPREGGIFTTGITPSNKFDARFLFTHPIDPNSLVSGAIIADSVELPPSKYYLDPNCNNYFLKVDLSGYNSAQFHDFRINSSKVKREDGSLFPYSFVAGYTIHDQSSAHLGDRSPAFKPRGKIKIDVIRIQKSLSAQQAISEYLSNKDVSTQSLIAYTSVSKTQGASEIYLAYITNPEPQIIQGFPLTHSLFPDVSAPAQVSLIFSTKLDAAQVTSVSGLFSIESDFATSVDVIPNDIQVLTDNRTIVLDTTSYFTDQRIYSILAKPGIRSDKGFAKVKPDQWTIHVNKYEGQAATVSGSFTGAPLDAAYLVSSPNSSLTNERVLSGINGLTGVIVGSNAFYISGLPATNSSAGVAYFSSQWFSGDTSGKFSLVESGVNHSRLTGLTSDDHTQYVPTNAVRGFTSAVSGIIPTQTYHLSTKQYVDNQITALSGAIVATGAFATTGDLASHTGDTTIHFVVGAIRHTDILNIGTNTHVQIDSHIASTSNPHGVTAAQAGAASTGSYAYLSGIVNGHVTNTSNPHSTTAAQVGAPTTSNYDYLSGQFSLHASTTGIHFTQDRIEIGSDQIVNFTEAVQDVVGVAITGKTGIYIYYDDPNGAVVVSGIYATTNTHGVSRYDSTQFGVTNGLVTITGSFTGSSAGGQPLDATLTTIAQQVTAADTYIYFTGVDLAYTGIITSYMRTVLDDTSATVARATLGLGALSTGETVWTAAINDDAVTFAKMQNSAAAGLSVLGRSTNSAGDFAEIAANLTTQILQRSGNSLVWGLVSGASLHSGTINYDRIQNVSATDRILGRSSAGAGAMQEITCTSTARSILDDTTVGAVRATLGLGIGTGVQAWSSALDEIAAISPSQGIIITSSDGVTWSRVSAGGPGAILTVNGDGILEWLEPGGEGDYLRIVGGIPAWDPP